MEPELVNQKDLAAIIGYDARQIRRWHDHPESPGRVGDLYPVERWKTFVAAFGRKSPSERKAELEAERLDINNRRAIWKHETERGLWTENHTISVEINRLVDELVSALRHTFEDRIPPRMVGRTIEEARTVAREELDELMRRIHKAPAGAIEALGGATE